MKTFPAPLQQTGRTFVFQGKRKLVYFAGCDYYRLASHPQVLAAAASGLRRYGLNVAASRKTTGNHELYARLERRLAKFFDAEGALLVSNGYLTNLVVAQAMVNEFSHALLDEKAHASLVDAAAFLGCPVLRFGHRDVKSLAAVLERLGSGIRPVLLTDGMFSHDGSVAPLRGFLKILPKESLVLLDDAHSAGVLGETGKGTVEFAGISRKQVIQTVTLSKAFGVYGGAVLASQKWIEKIANQSRAVVGNTPLPLPLASASLQALQTLSKQPSLRKRLHSNTARLKSELHTSGLIAEITPGPVLAIIPRNSRHANQLKRALLQAGIFPPFIQYPGGPPDGYFRFAIASEHSRAQLKKLAQVLLENK